MDVALLVAVRYFVGIMPRLLRSFLPLFLASIALGCAQGAESRPDYFERPKPDAGGAGGTGGTAGTGGSAGVAGTGGAPPTALCGNGEVEGDEACDQGDMAGKTCQTEGFASGGLQCTPDCKLDTSNCNTCGNNVADPGEECDGTDLGGVSTCDDINAGTAAEPLLCSPDCTYDLSNCSGCGDGVITSPEDCEPATATTKADLGGATCTDLGWDGGNLDCNASCRFNETGCYACGDAQKNGIEQCDGADFGGKGCGDFDAITGEPFTSGSLSCSGDCKIDTSNCMRCGDGVVTGSEVCDEGELNGETCETQGFSDGLLTCGATCKSYDVSACTLCGDGDVEGDEQCDSQNLNGATCQSLGFAGGGSLSCSGSCTFNTSGCSNNTCGDGTVNGADECDCGNSGSVCSAAQLDNRSCTDFTSPGGGAYAGGSLGCRSPDNCTFDTSACYYCGDGDINPGEQCDGSALGGQTCVGLGYTAGTLSCNGSCQLDESACISVENPVLLCNSPNLDIPDNDSSGVSDTINISDSATVTDVDVMLIVPHTWPGDVRVTLSHGGTTRTLIDRPGEPASLYGCSYDNIDCTLDDEGTAPVEETCETTTPAITGTLRPNEALAGFDGQDMSGAWTLTVSDIESGLTGTFGEWCVVVYWQ